jgi:hypothetical protein
MTDQLTSVPIGGTVPAARGEQNANLITAVEQVVGGDTLIAIARAGISRDGEIGRFYNTETIRLNPAERELLIRLLADHRFADLTATIGEEG